MTDDLIREINQAVQRERVTDIWKRYHNVVFGVLAALVLLGGGGIYLSMQQEAGEQISTRLLTDGREQFIAGKYEAAGEQFQAIREEDAAHPVLGALWKAKALIKRHQPEQAAGLLAETLAKAEEPYRSLVCIHGLMLELTDERFADCRQRASGAFAPLLQELAAIRHLRAGEYEAARAALPETHTSAEQQKRLADIKAYLASQAPAPASEPQPTESGDDDAAQ